MKKYILPLSFFLNLLVCLSADVEILWQWFIDNEALEVSQAHDETLIVVGKNKFFRVNPDTGNFIWQKVINEQIDSIPLIDDNGKFYLKLRDTTRRLAAFSIETGDEVWSYPSEYQFLGVPAYSNGIVYIVSKNRNPAKLIAVDANSGVVRWVHSNDYEIGDFIALSGDRIYIQQEKSDSTYVLIGLNSSTGQILQTIDYWNNYYWATKELIVGTTNFLHGYTYNRNGFSIDPSTGDWKVRYAAPSSSSIIIGQNNKIYFDSTTIDGIRGIDEHTGERIWEYEVPDANTSTSRLSVDSSGTLYFVYNGDQSLHSIDTTQLKSKFFNGNEIKSPTFRWRFEHEVNSYIIGKSGNLFIGGRNGVLTSIKGSAPVGNAPWPMEGGNAQRTFSKATPLPNDGFLNGYNWMGDFPWIYNQSTYTWFRMASSNDQFWLYNFSTNKWSDYSENPTQLGWAWMEHYPWIYNVADSTWYYLHQEESPYFLYNETTQEWLPLSTE